MMARCAMRRRLREFTGASVAITIMQEPAAESSVFGLRWSAERSLVIGRWSLPRYLCRDGACPVSRSDSFSVSLSLKSYRPSSTPTGAPLILSTPPKFVCTSTPTVYPCKFVGKRRDAVPMPPLNPKATVPVPAPTAPSSTGPDLALRIALKTSSRPTGRERMSFR